MTESQECGHAPDAGTHDGLHQRCPAKPDCGARHHLSFDVLQGDGFSRIRLGATDGASQLFLCAVGGEVVNMASSFLSDLAPPRDVEDYSQQKKSVLRI